MSSNTFNFAAPARTKREERKAKCGVWNSKLNVYYGGFVSFQIHCKLYQGPNACPECRRDTIARERANASEAGSWLYWTLYAHSRSSLKWKADRMWMRRHGIRYRLCSQNGGGAFLLTEKRHPNIPSLQQIKVEDIPWDTIMDRMPEGSSFRGTLRTPELPKENKAGYEIIWQKQVQVKAPPGVQEEAQRRAMLRTVDLDPRGKSAKELGAMMAKRIGIFEEELISLGGEIVTSRMRKIKVNLELVDWLSYSSRFTPTKERDPMLVTPSYAAGA